MSQTYAYYECSYWFSISVVHYDYKDVLFSLNNFKVPKAFILLTHVYTDHDLHAETIDYNIVWIINFKRMMLFVLNKLPCIRQLLVDPRIILYCSTGYTAASGHEGHWTIYFVGRCLATKIFIGKLLATRGIIGWANAR